MECKYHIISDSWENLLICHIHNRPTGVVRLRWFCKMNLVHTEICGFHVFDFFFFLKLVCKRSFSFLNIWQEYSKCIPDY